MPKLGLALSAAGAGPLRATGGNLAPVEVPQGSGSGGSGSGSSGTGIGEFLYSDRNILKMWLSDESQTSGIPAMDTTTGNAIQLWRDRSRNANVADSYNHPANAPIAVPESVTVSGAVVSNPGGYELPINGIYTRNGTVRGRPKFTKATANGINRELIIEWSLNGFYELRYSNGPSTILIGNIEGTSVPAGALTVISEYWDGDNEGFNGGRWTEEEDRPIRSTTFSGTITVTWSPAHASFDGTQYLTIPNPLTGDSADVFVVCKFDDLPVGEENGPLIGNIGTASEYERHVKQQNGRIGPRYSLFRSSSISPPAQYNNEFLNSEITKWFLLGFSSTPDGHYILHYNGGFNSFFNPAIENFYPANFSRTTYAANLISEGPYIGRSTQGGDIKFKGKIAEIMLYNRALTSSERTVVRNYLNQKYSLWV